MTTKKAASDSSTTPNTVTKAVAKPWKSQQIIHSYECISKMEEVHGKKFNPMFENALFSMFKADIYTIFSRWLKISMIYNRKKHLPQHVKSITDHNTNRNLSIRLDSVNNVYCILLDIEWPLCPTESLPSWYQRHLTPRVAPWTTKQKQPPLPAPWVHTIYIQLIKWPQNTEVDGNLLFPGLSKNIMGKHNELLINTIIFSIV